MTALPIILGSRSPRRLELLSHLVPRDRIVVCSPESSDEAGFEDLSTRGEFDERILDIARAKLDDVLKQIETEDSTIIETAESVLVLTGDTTVIATGPDGRQVSLGQPPDDSLDETVRLWFRDYFAGKTHEVVSGVCLARVPIENRIPQRENLRVLTRVCSTKVTMRKDVDQLLDWYLKTGESRGKAGGYAIQGAASVFVTRIEGSLSNVVGLPLEETLAMLSELAD
jgi:septum formation protein